MLHLVARFQFLALLISLLAVGGATPARGDIVAQYTFPTETMGVERTGPGFAATTTADNATATDIALSDSLPDPAEPFIADRAPPYGRPVLRIDPGDGSTSADEAIANGTFFEFSVTAADGFVINVDTLTFSAARGGALTPRGWVVLSDVDGFTNPIGMAEVPSQRPDLTSFAIHLHDPSFQGLTEVTFQIYTFVPNGGQSVEYVDVTLNGTVQ
ncbi:MAG TPA: hypothetical protein VGY77_07780 [Gemmataceae bacterium]|nr:hypothetical protein [Gemmataceae bacterium]